MAQLHSAQVMLVQGTKHFAEGLHKGDQYVRCTEKSKCFKDALNDDISTVCLFLYTVVL